MKARKAIEIIEVSANDKAHCCVETLRVVNDAILTATTTYTLTCIISSANIDVREWLIFYNLLGVCFVMSIWRICVH